MAVNLEQELQKTQAKLDAANDRNTELEKQLDNTKRELSQAVEANGNMREQLSKYVGALNVIQSTIQLIANPPKP